MKIVFEEGRKQSAAYDGEKPVGNCTYEEENGVWRVEHTYVDKDYGGQGACPLGTVPDFKMRNAVNRQHIQRHIKKDRANTAVYFEAYSRCAPIKSQRAVDFLLPPKIRVFNQK